MLHNPFRGMKKREWTLLFCSLLTVFVCNRLTAGSSSVYTRLGALVGVVALIFMARGDVWGQILTVVFSILYGITSWQFSYYGELITYVGMTLPMALLAVVSWLRHPYAQGHNEVEIQRLNHRQYSLMILLTGAVTAVLGVVLWRLDTPNLFFSILSIATSFLASYLTFMRSSYYALAFAANDVVLIVLWLLASLENPGYVPMIACFACFLANDIYAFFSWKSRERRQKSGINGKNPENM